MTARASPVRSIEIVPPVPETADDVAEWLLSVAAGQIGKPCSDSSLSENLRSCDEPYVRHASIDRCAQMIVDANLHVYQRGLAVTALGRLLGRDIGCGTTMPPRGAASAATLRQVY